MNHTQGQSPLTATRYTLYSWVLYLLPLTFGLVLTSIYQWSDFWATVVTALGFYVLINNVVVVTYHLYNRPASRLAILVQIYFACFFGLMIMSKAYREVWLEFILIGIFTINTLLGVVYRKNVFICGWYSKILLLTTISFPFVFAQIAHTYGLSTSLDAPGLMSSVAAGFTYYSGALVNSYYRV